MNFYKLLALAVIGFVMFSISLNAMYQDSRNTNPIKIKEEYKNNIILTTWQMSKIQIPNQTANIFFVIAGFFMFFGGTFKILFQMIRKDEKEYR